MTITASRPRLASMDILGRVTGNTFSGCAREYSIDMALRASSVDMRASQREGGLGVVESDIAPACGCVASCAVRPVLTVMLILRGMTGIAILWRAHIDSIHVTG